MWYQNAWRRHLCDMHINDWSPEFLSEFSPETYLENLKKAKIQSAMIYFQSHVGLCYFPTKSGKMHNALIGKEDAVKRLTELCHEAGIAVTGYYSLIYNNYEKEQHPEWSMIDSEGHTRRNSYGTVKERYGFCCPNNPDYRAFISEQINEMADYFTFDGLFFDMLFWPHACYCKHCQERWAKEVGGEMPHKEDWDSPDWMQYIRIRRKWMGEFAAWATAEAKKAAPHATVEHNFASGVGTLGGFTCVDESVNEACEFTGGDLYGGIHNHSFTCKFYKNITKHQPFEYMFSVCEPGLSYHTSVKSKDTMRSAVFLTAAHHGATLVIDAIDPVGTMDQRTYEQVGEVFAEEIPYEPYLYGEMLEDVGIYYSLKSKYYKNKEPYFCHDGAANTMKTLLQNHVCCGVTGSFGDLHKHSMVIAPLLTEDDAYETGRFLDYVQNGGHLYFSGAYNTELLKAFFGAEYTGRTEETVVYIAPDEKYPEAFGRFNAKYPKYFEGTAPITTGFAPEDVIATITLPYTKPTTFEFASIHSNPPGIPTKIPAMAAKQFGKGKVFWSALPIECEEYPTSRHFFFTLLKEILGFESSFSCDGPDDVEITVFDQKDRLQVNAVQLTEEYKARKIADFTVSVKSAKCPAGVNCLPDETPIPFEYRDGAVHFAVCEMDIFRCFTIQF